MYFCCQEPKLDRCLGCAGIISILTCGLGIACFPCLGCYNASKRSGIYALLCTGIWCFIIPIWGWLVGIIIGVKLIQNV